MNTEKSVLTKNQTKTFDKVYTEAGITYRIKATVRYDDRCGNGHNTFSITGNIDRKDTRGVWREDCGGCIHEDIAKRFPALAPFVKWHLVSSDQPWGYIENTVYFAGDRDCWGMRKGEFKQHTSRGKIQNDGVEGVPNWTLVVPERAQRDVYATEKPDPVTCEWVAQGRTGEGKERNLDFARNAAVWPEATDAELTQEPEALKAALLARLPALMLEFRKAVESFGFTF